MRWGKSGSQAQKGDLDYRKASAVRNLVIDGKAQGDGVMADDTKAIPLKSSRIPAWFYCGKDWSSKGDYDKAIRLDPDNQHAIRNRAVAVSMKHPEG